MRSCRVTRVEQAPHGWFYWCGDSEKCWTSFEIRVGDVAWRNE